jgi:hypothetical protein
MQFISIVGSQVMAVLNPILSLVKSGSTPKQVVLLYTSFSENTARKIKEFLISNKMLSDGSVVLIAVSSGANANEDAPAPEDVVDRYLREPDSKVTFNMAGGMNFQIAACAMRLAPYAFEYVYPESTVLHWFKIANARIREESKLPLPKPRTVLELLNLQGVKFTISEGKRRITAFHRRLAEKYGLTFLADDRIPEIVINGVKFDVVYNDGNTLKFIIVSEKPPESSLYDPAIKIMGRRLLSLVLDRSNFSELFHRGVEVYTNHRSLAERLTNESMGKIRVHHEYAGSCQREEVKTPVPDIVKIRKQAQGQGTLLSPIGLNLLPTLLSICSHKPRVAILPYTPGNPVIESHRRSIERFSACLPATELRFVPVSIVGSEILDINASDGTGLSVNITAGTKGQTVFGCLWAKNHNAGVFSLDNSSSVIRSITDNSELAPITGLPMLDLLRFQNTQISDPGNFVDQTSLDRKPCESAIQFMRAMIDNGKSLEEFPNSKSKEKSIVLPDAELVYKGRELRMKRARRLEVCHLSIEDDMWFERVIGHIFHMSGADEVRTRIRTKWQIAFSPRRGGAGKSEPVSPVFKDDIDVVARYGTNYIVVECKASKKQFLETWVPETSARSRLFGRFAIPMLCFMKYAESPYYEDDVLVFGNSTFTDFSRMREMIENALQKKRTTRESA